MNQWIRRLPGRGSTLMFGVAGALLSGVSCSENDVVGPTDSDGSDDKPVASTSAAALTFSQVSGGRSHTCGLTSDHRLFCWGHNGFGQLGDGTVTSRVAPRAVATTLRFQQVSAAYDHTCAVTTDYRAFCWG